MQDSDEGQRCGDLSNDGVTRCEKRIGHVPLLPFDDPYYHGAKLPNADIAWPDRETITRHFAKIVMEGSELARAAGSSSVLRDSEDLRLAREAIVFSVIQQGYGVEWSLRGQRIVSRIDDALAESAGRTTEPPSEPAAPSPDEREALDNKNAVDSLVELMTRARYGSTEPEGLREEARAFAARLRVVGRDAEPTEAQVEAASIAILGVLRNIAFTDRPGETWVNDAWDTISEEARREYHRCATEALRAALRAGNDGRGSGS